MSVDPPVPVDDGAADHLPGREVPELSLPSTLGGQLDLAAVASGSVRQALRVPVAVRTAGR